MMQRRSNNRSAGEFIEELEKRPYDFVSLPDTFDAQAPIWHDGSMTKGRLSGEVRFEIKTLTPLLVGWESKKLSELGMLLDGVPDAKLTLSPLRAPWDPGPVLIPGDSLKGLLRHELGALLGAPMERVAERSYSYRPNATYQKGPTDRLQPRLARIIDGEVEFKPLLKGSDQQVRVPRKLELLPDTLRYDKRHERRPPYYEFADGDGPNNYHGGQGAGESLNLKKRLHATVRIEPDRKGEVIALRSEAIDSYLATLNHLVDNTTGHFSARHPGVPKEVTTEQACSRILEAAKNVVFQPDDIIWVEWDVQNKRIVSFGWHYYYRWAYQDSVRRRGTRTPRNGLFPTEDELRLVEEEAPEKLTAVRRLFGYTGDNDGSEGIGRGNHSQLMGRISINAAIEVVKDGAQHDDRFIKHSFLKELGQPKPSAVEHYLQQKPDQLREGRKDDAILLTYGDVSGDDKPGELAGRKFYLDREGAKAEDPSAANKENLRSTLAINASKPGRTFRFTLRFRDLDKRELAAILLALCPNQFKGIQGAEKNEYCSKLGYARPLGWGSVQIQAKQLFFLEGTPVTLQQISPQTWFDEHKEMLRADGLEQWLSVHQRNHRDAAEYPRMQDDGPVYSYHTTLRSQHAQRRRNRRRKQP